ncbi:DUF4034 domain-containing protein [Asanoa sp. WMMD1127]|uniref:DUF4034 domain-containing protein n=1 Tax=Asanoa sp. WMMD1127 TaxID=3016107 RepID=UPI0024172C3A|nr:DUF4034 domain-containing protein [Asanoa sp. WMMD1127]MDG4824652.1 DUF4034 domain-containing protein [Asanoa sp. WMMD1127]
MWPFGKRRQQAGLVIDPAQGDPRARALIDALGARDWQATRDILAAATDPDTRAYLLEIAGDVDGVQDWIGEWAQAEPGSTLPLLVRGSHAVYWAWAARGAQGADRTKDEQFRAFFRRLRIAEDLLDEVVARDPDEVAGWTWLVMSSRGRQVAAEEAQARFDEVVKRHPGHVVAHEHRLQYLCAKWFGSHEQMFALAREATAQAPDGSLLPELVVIAHLEKWLSLPRGEDDAYLRSPEVRAEILAAAQRSVLHPAFTPDFGWVPRTNAFAMGLRMAGELDAAARVFDLLGDQVGGWTWRYLGDPVKAFTEARKAAYANRA